MKIDLTVIGLTLDNTKQTATLVCGDAKRVFTRDDIVRALTRYASTVKRESAYRAKQSDALAYVIEHAEEFRAFQQNKRK